MPVDYSGEGFFVLGGGVISLVTFGLAFDVGVDLSSSIDDGADPTTFHKCRCHIVKGRSGSTPLDLFDGLGSPKITSSHRIHESTTDT